MGDALEAHVLRVRGLHLILPEWLHFGDGMLGDYTCMINTRNVFGHYSVVCGEVMLRTSMTPTMGSVMINDTRRRRRGRGRQTVFGVTSEGGHGSRLVESAVQSYGLKIRPSGGCAVSR